MNNTSIVDYIGKTVLIFRTDRGLTQEQLAEKSGFTQGYISAIEHGNRHLGHLSSLQKVSRAFGCQLSELVRYAEELREIDRK
ncbi:MAG: helix-turn-helix transcriptional regulator [Candidatus Pacearchaeota archaeon]